MTVEDEAYGPIYIFQMGKVGSVSVQDTLAQHFRNRIIHAHCYEEMSPSDQELLVSRRKLGLPVTIITPVRDPLARNVSAFFQTFKRDTGFELADRPWSPAELLELFLQRYPHEESLEWFDVSFRPMIGLDVYAVPFPREKKWAAYNQDSLRILIYRTDLARAAQLAAISGFMGHRFEAWTLGNRAEDKDYAGLYREFCAQAVLPEAYIARLNESRFCQHFWTEAERQANADPWRRR